MRKPKRIVRLTLPYPPTINHYYIKGRILTTKARQFFELVRYSIALDTSWTGIEFPLRCRLGMSLVVYPPDKRVRDLDNVLKGVKDSLKQARDRKTGIVIWPGVMLDDKQVVKYLEPFGWGPVVEGGKVEVTLEEI